MFLYKKRWHIFFCSMVIMRPLLGFGMLNERLLQGVVLNAGIGSCFGSKIGRFSQLLSFFKVTEVYQKGLLWRTALATRGRNACLRGKECLEVGRVWFQETIEELKGKAHDVYHSLKHIHAEQQPVVTRNVARHSRPPTSRDDLARLRDICLCLMSLAVIAFILQQLMQEKERQCEVQPGA